MHTLTKESELFAGHASVGVVPEVVADGPPVSSEADLQRSLQLLLCREATRDQAKVSVHTGRVVHCKRFSCKGSSIDCITLYGLTWSAYRYTMTELLHYWIIVSQLD